MRSHISVNARILQVSSTNRMPEFTKKLIDANTCGNRSSATWPDSRTASSTPTAVARLYAISCVGGAPASCRWYEQTFIGFHLGIHSAQNATMSTISRRDGSGGKMYVPRDRYSLTMSFCVVPRSSFEPTPWRSALATYRPNSHAAGALMVID